MAVMLRPRCSGPPRCVAAAAACLIFSAPSMLSWVLKLTASPFEASIGLTRSQVEARFREIDGNHTVFKAATAIAGTPRVLGRDKRLYTIVEVNGYPEVVNVQVVTVLDTGNKTTLENQVVFDSLACGVLADETAQKWCTGRILNTNSRGLVTATTARSFGPVRVTVKTYQSSKSSSPPVVSVSVTAS